MQKRGPHQTALSIAYGAGLRASEVVALTIGDVESRRMTLHIEQGKGRDHSAMLSPVLLERLRAWWRVAHAQGGLLANLRAAGEAREDSRAAACLSRRQSTSRHSGRTTSQAPPRPHARHCGAPMGIIDLLPRSTPIRAPSAQQAAA
jgi:integrase